MTDRFGSETTAGSAVGRRGSRYELVRVIGRGGMGEVWLAWQKGAEGFRRAVAMKRMRPEFAEDHAARSMFIAEAQRMAEMNHPNICQTIELTSISGELYLVLEYLSGVPFSTVMKECGALPQRLVAGIMVQICAGLSHAHGRRLVHRDLSPSNVFITDEGLVKILDFGIAKALDSGRSTTKLYGKAGYLAPEQILGEPVDERCDLFSAATLAVEALTGFPMFSEATDYKTFQKILKPEGPRIAVPSALAPLLEGCLQVDKTKRPRNARALGTEIALAVAKTDGVSTQFEISDFVRAHFSEQCQSPEENQLQSQTMSASLFATHPELTSNVTTPQSRSDEDSDVNMASPTWRALPGLIPRKWGFVAVAAALAVVAWLVYPLVFFRGVPEEKIAAVEVGHAPDAVVVPTLDRQPKKSPEAAVDTAADTSPETTEQTHAAGKGAEKKRDIRRTDRPKRSSPKTSVQLPAQQRWGFLSIDARPYAKIEIDGEDAGFTPLLKHRLRPGTYKVVATTAEGQVKRFRIKVGAGAKVVRRLTFE